MRSKILQEILDETPIEVDIFVQWYADILLRVNQLLNGKGYTQKDLAEKLSKSPSEISKWLNGNHNFTLRSLAKLQAELGEPILQIVATEVVVKSIETTPVLAKGQPIYQNLIAVPSNYYNNKTVSDVPPTDETRFAMAA